MTDKDLDEAHKQQLGTLRVWGEQVLQQAKTMEENVHRLTTANIPEQKRQKMMQQEMEKLVMAGHFYSVTVDCVNNTMIDAFRGIFKNNGAYRSQYMHR